jgi:hypothetical protein
LDLEANCHVFKDKKHNHENGKEYAQIPETPYWNLMVEKQVLKIEETPVGHKLFLPQEVVRCEVWTSGFKKRHNYR